MYLPPEARFSHLPRQLRDGRGTERGRVLHADLPGQADRRDHPAVSRSHLRPGLRIRRYVRPEANAIAPPGLRFSFVSDSHGSRRGLLPIAPAGAAFPKRKPISGKLDVEDLDIDVGLATKTPGRGNGMTDQSNNTLSRGAAVAISPRRQPWVTNHRRPIQPRQGRQRVYRPFRGCGSHSSPIPTAHAVGYPDLRQT